MDIKRLNDCGSLKFICVYAKDERFQTIFNNLLIESLKTSSYAFKEPTNQEELMETVTFSGVAPLGYTRWVSSINTDKVRLNKTIATQMQDSNYSTNLIYSSNFKTHTIMRKLFSYPKKDYLELMFVTLNMDKLFFLQELIVPKKNRLETGLLKKVLKGYRTRPEKVLDLFYYLKELPIENFKDIVSLLGSPDNTMEKFLLKLLTVEIISERSLETQIKNRYKEIEDLILQIGYESCIGYMKHTLKDIIYIKEQYTAGVLYKSVTRQKIEYKSDGSVFESDRDLTYIKKNLSIHIETIKSIPMSRILLLYNELNRHNTFKDKMDSYKFLIGYMVSVVDYQNKK